MTIDELLSVCVDKNATDLLVSPGAAPMVRIEQALESLDVDPTTAQQTEQYAQKLCRDDQLKRLKEHGSVDLSVQRNGADYRVAVYQQNKEYSLAIRYLRPDLPGLSNLDLPERMTEVCENNQGAVFVTGAAGTGKTTTINSMLDYINENFRRHIITLEDPIEFHHEHKKSLIEQREVGRDVSSFKEGIRSVVRFDPDVIFVGEMRDPETMQAAITAAETGHLVFSTLHTRSAGQTVNRIIDSFPATQQNQIRAQLSMSLRAVLSQRLLPRRNGDGMVAAFEVLFNTTGVSNMIREGNEEQIESTIQTSRDDDMRTIEQHLAYLVSRGRIARDDARKAANDEQTFRSALTNNQSMN